MKTLRLIVLGVLFLGACQPSEPPKGDKVLEPVKSQVKDRSAIAAKIDNRDITLEELDKPIRLPLYDLEQQVYKLRKAELNKLAATASKAHKASGDEGSLDVDFLLEPPFPPRLALPIDRRPVKGHEKSPVRVSVFCSYQSSHCARLQPVLSKIETRYDGDVSFAYYDFPQGFHRFGRSAANAARCAANQTENLQALWDFQSSLYGAYDDLNKKRYRLIGDQLGLDSAAFKLCLDEQTFLGDVKKDVALSQQLGLGAVPIVLINGLYVKGPQPFSVYQYYIDFELERLNIKTAKSLKMRKSDLPIDLQGAFVSEAPDIASRAILEFTETAQVGTYNEGDELLGSVFLVEIRKDRVIIDNDGRSEYILIQQSYGENSPKSTRQKNRAGANVTDQNKPSESKDAFSKSGTLPDKSKVVLSRAWLTDQLSQQAVLEKRFKAGEHKASGFNLMKLEDINESEFFKTLGLKSGDVIMQVNEEWLHSGQNPLWNSLRLSNNIEIVIMRNGRPVRYYYRVRD